MPKYCNVQCLGKGRKEGAIPAPGLEALLDRARRGIKPSNIYKGMKLSPNFVMHQFKKGQVSPNKKQVGTETLRRDHDGPSRYWVKVAEDVWKPRAWVVWEKHSGQPVPKGFVIRHVNGDRLDDCPENLIVMAQAESGRVIANNLEVQKRARYNQSLVMERRRIPESRITKMRSTPLYQQMWDEGYDPNTEIVVKIPGDIKQTLREAEARMITRFLERP